MSQIKQSVRQNKIPLIRGKARHVCWAHTYIQAKTLLDLYRKCCNAKEQFSISKPWNFGMLKALSLGYTKLAQKIWEQIEAIVFKLFKEKYRNSQQ